MERMGDNRNVYRVVVSKLEVRRSRIRCSSRRENNIKINRKGVEVECGD